MAVVLYGLLCLTIQSDDASVTLPIGTPIAVFNIVRGYLANNKLASEFTREALPGQRVRPGQTAYGLIYLTGTNNAPLGFSLEDARQAERR